MMRIFVFEDEGMIEFVNGKAQGAPGYISACFGLTHEQIARFQKLAREIIEERDSEIAAVIGEVQ